jgi:hypothetical protein
MNKSVAGMRRYIIEFSIGMILFMLVILFHRRLLPLFPGWETLVYLLPTVPVLMVAAAIWRGVTAMDEYHRRNTLNAVAFGAFFLGVCACLYPFLRNAGLIGELRFGMAWPVMAVGWIMAAFRYVWRDAVGDGGRGKAFWQIGSFFASLAGAAFLYWLLASAMGWPRGWGALFAAFGFGAIPAALYQVFIRRCGQA